MFKKRSTKPTGIDLDQIKQQAEAGEGAPQKRAKVEKPEMSNPIGGTTASRKNEAQDNVRSEFSSLAYRVGYKNTEEVLAGDEATEHETEEAKRRYLQNVEITKKIKQGKLSTKIYRGANGYANYKLSEQQLQNPQDHYKWKHGPVREGASKGAKNTCRFDYDPSLCKDWHDSGYCVFGNSCIYLHDRSNYKNGWELEKDFEKSERQRWRRIQNPDLDEDAEHLKDMQKFKPQETCKLCDQPLKQPVQVSCKHIFCRKCAYSMIEKDSKCMECGKIINGILNNAEKSLAKQKQAYEQMLKSASAFNEKAQAKRTRFKDSNSLDVFAAQ